jgi:hypothetical protein
MIYLKSNRLIILISLIGLVVFTNLSIAQTVDYEDLYNGLSALSPQQKFSRLFSYQNQNPHFANTYVQLGDAAEKILENLDPLRDFELVDYWVGNAVLYYSLFPAYLQSNEVRRNREFYANLTIETAGRKIENDDVIGYVLHRSAVCNNFKDTVTLIYRALQKSKDHYNNSVRIFNQINEKYDNLNELLLQTDQGFMNQLNLLEKEFTQCVSTFDYYKSLLQAFPLSKHNQVYKLKKIETYRLDGLTNSDFLKDTFDLWDYGDWIGSFKKVYNDDIVSLRHEIASIQKLFNDNKRKLALVESVGPDDKFASFDDFFLFRLGKYDNSSLIRELFRYLNSRQDFLILDKSPLNNPNDSSSVLMNRKLRYYHRMAMQQMATVDMLNIFMEAINPERIIRFKEFFDQQYGGQNGLISFIDQEKQFLDQTINSALQNLKTYLDNESTTKFMLGKASGSRGISIPLYPVSTDSAEYKTLSHVTCSVSEIQGQWRFVSGFMQRSGQKPMAFAAKIDPASKVEWVREIGAKGKDALPQGDMAKHIVGFDKGSMILVSGNTAENDFKNKLIRLDDKGKDVFSKEIDVKTSPIFFQFDEINQVSLMGFAAKEVDSLNIYNRFTLCKTDSLGNTEWNTPIELRGQLVDIIRIEGKYIAFFNFSNYFIDGKQVNAGSSNQHMAHVMIELSESGELIRHSPIMSNQSYMINRIFSISNDEINLIGNQSHPYLWDEKLNFLVVTPQGKIIYKNIGD